MLRRALIAALVVLATPAAASAATVTRDGSTLRYEASSGIRDLLTLSLPNAATIRFATSNIGDVLAQSGCNPPAGGNIDCARAGITRIVVTLKDGQDVLTTATGFPIAMTIEGGTGVDVLGSSVQADVIRGDEDGDNIQSAGGADDISGGPGFDSARFSALPAVRVSLDDVANDGQAGGAEGANVRADVEDLLGTSGDDTLIGSDLANDLDGGSGGNDTLDGRGGLDFYTLGEGNDTALARDGLGERIVCGEGADTVTGDDIDELGGCESASLSGELVRDLDHDGFSKPADCNDSDPAFRPGAPDVPDDGIDQDCDGVDATDRDRDRDGVPRPFDCDDGNPRAAPGKRERFGNKVDEDCNGRADPLQTITTPVRARFIAAPGAARIVRLIVVGAKKGTRVQVRCKGSGCPFAKRKLKLKRTTRRLDLRKRFDLRRIGRQTLEVRLLRSDSIGRVVRFSGKGGGIPATRILCLAPGKKKPRSCGR